MALSLKSMPSYEPVFLHLGIRQTLEQMGVSCVYESCTNHSPQISEAKISATSRPSCDATPHEATFIVVALPPAQVPFSLSRAQG